MVDQGTTRILAKVGRVCYFKACKFREQGDVRL